MSKTFNLAQNDVDHFYHHLRVMSQAQDSDKEAILGLVGHLLGKEGDYPGLCKYLTWYGTNYLIKWAIIEAGRYKFDLVVDLGCGYGWLGKGIAKRFNVPYLGVDKRDWGGNVILDLEKMRDRKKLLKTLNTENPIICMSSLLHCLDNPAEALKDFSWWPWVVIQYNTSYHTWGESYVTQVKSYGGNPMSLEEIESLFRNRPYREYKLTPYVMYAVDGEGK